MRMLHNQNFQCSHYFKSAIYLHDYKIALSNLVLSMIIGGWTQLWMSKRGAYSREYDIGLSNLVLLTIISSCTQYSRNYTSNALENRKVSYADHSLKCRICHHMRKNTTSFVWPGWFYDDGKQYFSELLKMSWCRWDISRNAQSAGFSDTFWTIPYTLKLDRSLLWKCKPCFSDQWICQFFCFQLRFWSIRALIFDRVIARGDFCQNLMCLE